MKKFLALMLCAIMTVCAVVPAFAANELTPSEPTDPFIEANVITVNFIDYVDDQPDLFDNREYWAENNKPDYDKAGFYTSKYGYITFWGGTEIDESAAIWEGKTFQVKFDAPEAGYYSFAVDIGCGGDAGEYIPVRIDDGETYKILLNGKWQADAIGQPVPVTYYGMDNMYLEAGEHTFHIAKLVGSTVTQYYFGFKYTYVTDSGATPDAPVVEDPITPPPSDDEDEIVFADEVLTPGEPTDPFVEADIVELHLKGFADKQTIKNNTVDGVFTPDYSTPGFAPEAKYNCVTLWGPIGEEWNGATYQVPFTAEEAGYYSFAIDITCGGEAGEYVPVRVDDGETYKVLLNGKWTATEEGYPAPLTYYGMDNIYLEAGEHVFHVGKIIGTKVTQYYHTVYYTYVTEEPTADEPDTPDTPDTPDAPTYEVVFADEVLTASEPTDPFVEADIVELHLKDFADKQTIKNNTVDGVFTPDYSTPGFAPEAKYNCVTLWGPEGENWNGATYQVPFTAEEAGYYSFAIGITCGGEAGEYVPVRVDDGETYKVLLNGKWTATAEGYPSPLTYYGMDEIYLEAGEHVFHVGKIIGTKVTQYYHTVYYTYYTDEPIEDEPETDAPETDAPETDAPETDAPETDAPETDAPETDAPETDAPETDAPETDAPETDAPETDAPETDAPETDAPTTDDPADEKGAPGLPWVILGVAAVLVVVAAVILARKKK